MKFTQPCIIPVVNATTQTAPGSPTTGDTYKCLSGSGSWITGNVAQYNGATWDYSTLLPGTIIYNEATGLFLDYQGNVIPTATSTSTFTNKSLTPRLSSTASTSTPTPNADTTDEYILTALAVGATFGAPTGTPVQGQVLIIRIKDNGTAQTLAWTITAGGYRAVGCTLPTTTTISKALYVACVYNADENFFDVVGVQQL